MQSYNSRRHRFIEMSPNAAERQENWPQVAANLEKHYYAPRALSKKAVYKEGDHVRIAESRNQFSRSYDPYFRAEIFVVDRVSDKFPIPVYFLKDPEDGRQLLAGFYATELIKVKGYDQEKDF